MPKTVAKFQKEREEILQEVFRILGVDENNNIIGFEKVVNKSSKKVSKKASKK